MTGPERFSPKFKNGILLFLFSLSGLSALVYEVLWLKQLGLLFGNTAYAASTTLGAFFTGLSVGGFFWGRKSAGNKTPLRTYAFLELGICATALLYLVISKAYYAIYPLLFEILGPHPSFFLLVKFILASSLLFLPAFFMGGTFPIMGQQLIRTREHLGRNGSLLYAFNTAGAALGAFVAGFYLPIIFGYRNSYFLACSLNLGIAFIAYYLSRSEAKPVITQRTAPESVERPSALPKLLGTISFVSGFVTLTLEVLWTQMFKQVLQNSVYSFSVVLVTFLLSLAIGSFVANILCRTKKSPFAIMTILMVLSGISVYISPAIFYRLTNGLAELSIATSWNNYVLAIFGLAALVIFFPCTIMGIIFPFLLKMYQQKSEGAGQTIGRLTAINTIGAIFGSICAGFIFVNYVGIWTSIKIMAVLYFIVAAVVMEHGTVRRFLTQAAVGTALVSSLLLFLPLDFPVVKVSAKDKEKLYEVWQGSYGTVAVIRRGRDLKIKINNTYDIGGSASVSGQSWQAHIPLFLHPNPQKVFFLGMGTGITAGGALSHPVKKVVVCELIPEVVQASQKYFSKVTNHLYDDPRAQVLVEDGRNFLLGTKEKYDVVISDLFTPWRAGIGSLYSREHFTSVQSHLNQNGLFAQWLPLAQLSKSEFCTIAKTMASVFPQVTMWRLNTEPSGPIIVLIGQDEKQPLEPNFLNRNVQHVLGSKGSYVVPYIYYVGNITANADLFEAFPINTEDQPTIEYLAPIARQQAKIGASREFVGFEFIRFYNELLERTSPERDPYLKNLNIAQVDYIYAGLDLYKVKYFYSIGMLKQAKLNYKNYLSHIPIDIYPELAE